MATPPFPTLAGITLPSSQLIVAGRHHVQTNISPDAYRHSVRCAYWALMLAKKLPQFATVEVRAEFITLACLMHDFGWSSTEELTSKDKRFEVDSANAAVELVRGQTQLWDDRALEQLWVTIAIHSTSSIAQHYPVPEVTLVHLGILCDFFGPNLPPPFPHGLISTAEYKEVIEAYPVRGFKADMIRTMCGLCESKKSTTFDNVVGDFGEMFGLDGKGKHKEEYTRERQASNMTNLVLSALEACETLQE